MKPFILAACYQITRCHTTVHDNSRRCCPDCMSTKMQLMMHVDDMDNTCYAVITSYVVVSFRNKAIQRRRKGWWGIAPRILSVSSSRVNPRCLVDGNRWIPEALWMWQRKERLFSESNTDRSIVKPVAQSSYQIILYLRCISDFTRRYKRKLCDLLLIPCSFRGMAKASRFCSSFRPVRSQQDTREQIKTRALTQILKETLCRPCLQDVSSLWHGCKWRRLDGRSSSRRVLWSWGL